MRHGDHSSRIFILIVRILVDVVWEIKRRHKCWARWIRLEAASIAADVDSTAGASYSPHSSVFGAFS